MKKFAVLGILAVIATAVYLTKSPEQSRPQPPRTVKSNVFRKIEKLKSERAPVKEPSQKESQALYQKFKSIQVSDPLQARKLLEEGIELDPYSAPALADMSDTLLSEDRFEQARDFATRCLAVDVKNSVCHRTLISTYTRQGLLDEAYPYLQDCLAEDPGNVHCLGATSNYWISLGNPKEAKFFVDQLAKAEPDSVWSHLAQAEYFGATGDQEQSQSHYKAACKLGQPFACSQVRAR